MIMIGSVLFFKKNSSFISRTIAKLTKSEFTHVGLIVAYDETTKVATIIESNRFIKTRLSIIQIDNKHAVYSTSIMTDEMKRNVVKFAYKELGKDYDYLQIVGLFISLLFKEKRIGYFNSKNRLICTELIDIVYLKSGIKRNDNESIGNITPSELLEKYNMIKIEIK
jgi:hypothetical protein